MNSDDVRAALDALPGRPIDPAASISPLGTGWSARVFRVAPGWIVRFPRNAAAAARQGRAGALLPVVARSVSFAVPVVAHAGMHDGLRFSVHREVPGAAARAGQVSPPAFAAALAELHDVPPAAVTAAVGLVRPWLERYEDLRAEVAAKVLPILGPGLAARVARGIDAFIGGDLNELGPPRLIHADLGADHLLTDGARITGIIDFEDATLGDPAIDLVGIRLLEGKAFAAEVIRLHPHLDAAVGGRLDFYTWMGSVHAIIYGIDESKPREVEAGIAGLRQRIG